MILPDANVWFSLATTGHSAHDASMAWFATVPVDEQIAFCRITQLTLLRLLTAHSFMREQALTQRQAWQQYEAMLEDLRIVLADEPPGLSSSFKEYSDRDEVSPKRWADDYLAAFALMSRSQLVTYDRALAARVHGAVLLTP